MTATPKFHVQPFKGGWAVFRDGELITRTQTKEHADDYVARQLDTEEE